MIIDIIRKRVADNNPLGGNCLDNNQGRRIAWIDITKGILIICLVYGHHKLFAIWSDHEDIVTDFIHYSMGIYSAFFMQTFFIITGLCSKFSSSFSYFLWKHVKTLIIPSVILIILSSYFFDVYSGSNLSFNHFKDLLTWVKQGGPWFILALFWAKILYWPLLKFCNKQTQLVIVVVLYFIGLALNQFDYFPNYMFHRHTFLMMPYLAIGVFLKQHMTFLEKHLNKLAIIGFILLLFQTLSSWLIGTPLIVHDANIGVSFKSFPVHIVNVLLGTCFIFKVSKTISKNGFLQTMGKGTLLVYLIDSTVERISLSLCSQLYNNSNILACILYHCISFALSIVIFYILIRIIYCTKYLSWIVGKW